MRKTPDMERLELQEWTQRLGADPAARRRDIREVIQAAFDEAAVDAAAVDSEPTSVGAARILGISPATLSAWIARLGGSVRGRAVFPNFQPTSEPNAISVPAQEPVAV